MDEQKLCEIRCLIEARSHLKNALAQNDFVREVRCSDDWNYGSAVFPYHRKGLVNAKDSLKEACNKIMATAAKTELERVEKLLKDYGLFN